MAHKVTLIYGDGIGQEVVGATRRIIEEAGVRVDWEVCEAGAEVFKKGLPSGVPKETIDSISRTRVVLKGPLETPVGFGEKSANVTLRKLFETYANIRPVREFPNVKTPFSGRGVDFVIVRENVEDLYAGIEYMQSPGVAECLKLISRKGCEKIIRYAFEFARSEGRKTVHCATKANIMKFSEGLVKKVFEEIAPDYPDIEAQHIIVDNCAHQMVRTPENFDVVVMTNMNGDILSDLGSGLVGGLGFAPGANIGSDISIFEAVHGSAPKYAGKNMINPTAVLLSGTMMLRKLGEFEAAWNIEQALLVTLESGCMTRDILKDNPAAATTTEFTDKIIGNFGKTSTAWKRRPYKEMKMPQVSKNPVSVHCKNRQIVGIDVFIEAGLEPEALGKELEKLVTQTPFVLKGISNRGVRVYPLTGTYPDTVDSWTCRFMLKDEKANTTDAQILELLTKIGTAHVWNHVEKLSLFDGEMSFSKAQGED